ncbi:MAG: hypothetical protein IJD12_02550 [Tidjanibacter sp.]|nr:hypothetical protein [Tidjanibacter sp.]MBQ3070550.1 hypothetical protein [Tidjanibacter sp.]
MTKKTYNAPAIEQEKVVLEAGIAVSGTEEIIINPDGVTPEAWKEGNTDWF